MSAVKGSKFYMGGTDGSGEYVVVVTGTKAKVGYRDLGGGSFRIRIEPAVPSLYNEEIYEKLGGQWNTPTHSQNRFSIQVSGEESMKKALSHALSTIGLSEDANPDAPVWALDLIKNPVDWSAGVTNKNKHDDDDEPEHEDEDSDEDEDEPEMGEEDLDDVTMSKSDLETLIEAAEKLASNLRLYRAE